MRAMLAACLLSFGTLAGLPALAAEPTPYNTADTPIGTLLDDPAAKAVLDKHMPGFSGNPQVAMARSMTFKQVQSMAPDQIPADALAKIDADLAKLPVKK